MNEPLAPLTDRERVDWLQLARSEGIGPRTFADLLRRFKRPAAALEALPALMRRRGDICLAARDSVLRELESGQKRGFSFVALTEPEYPAVLRAIDSAPPVITVRGRIALLQKTMVAVVGSRNASAPGLVFTERLAQDLGRAGCVVVSGLARGIDAKAHRASLATGTVAVLAGGHDRIYPSDHTEMAARIAETGAVLSEMPLSWEPRARDFPRRNRLVSGLARATVIVEAARRSGSLITARFANEQGREVFAVPGSPLEPRAEGTNDLIRQGASLCTSAEDVLEALARAQPRPAGPSSVQQSLWEHTGEDTETYGIAEGEPVHLASDDLTRVADLLGPAPIALDDLVRVSGLSAARLRTVLFDLELEGRAFIQGGMVAGFRTGA